MRIAGVFMHLARTNIRPTSPKKIWERTGKGEHVAIDLNTIYNWSAKLMKKASTEEAKYIRITPNRIDPCHKGSPSLNQRDPKSATPQHHNLTKYLNTTINKTHICPPIKFFFAKSMWRLQSTKNKWEKGETPSQDRSKRCRSTVAYWLIIHPCLGCRNPKQYNLL